MAQESWKCDQDETGCQPPEGPILCANNCGFFGSKATMNLCSKCYRDVVLSQAKASSAKTALEQLPLLINKEVPGAPSQASQAGGAAAAVADPPPSGGSSVVAAASLDMEINSSSSSGASTPVLAAPGQELPSASRPPNRCFACNKRVGLTGFSCRCGNMFCSLHRYSDKHNCTFDYKAVGRDAIAKANPVVKADKIDKI